MIDWSVWNGAAITPPSASLHLAFHPGGTDEQLDWYNDLCRKTLTPEIARPTARVAAMIDVTELLGKVRAPTLVLHARGDAVAPIAEDKSWPQGFRCTVHRIGLEQPHPFWT